MITWPYNYMLNIFVNDMPTPTALRLDELYGSFDGVCNVLWVILAKGNTYSFNILALVQAEENRTHQAERESPAPSIRLSSETPIPRPLSIQCRSPRSG